MPNLEELIEMRKSSIKKALKYYDTIEEKLKENAKYFYNNYINPELERQAKTNVNSAGIIYLINDEYVLSAPIVDRNSPIGKWLSSIMNGDDNILLIAICKLLNITEDPIIAIDISEKPEDDRNYLCFKVSNIKEIVEQDGLNLEIDESNNVTTYQVTANAPKLEVPEYKEATTRSEELYQIRENAIEEYQEQLARECNIIEKQLMTNSIDYYVKELYGKLKSNIENDKALKIVDYSFQDAGMILETDGATPKHFFNSIENSSNRFKKLQPYNYMRYITINGNPIIYTKSENGEWVVRLSYLKELAEKDELNFKVKDICGDKISFSLTKQNLPKLELPKHKVLTIKD